LPTTYGLFPTSLDTSNMRFCHPAKIYNMNAREQKIMIKSYNQQQIFQRIVIAPIGSFIINDEGEEITVKKTTVGGVVSEGIFCDAKMLGWAGGAQGIAAQVPDSFELGSAPPPTKPGSPSGNTNGDGNNAGESAAVEVKGLFEKKLTKEEKKKLAEEKRKARKAAKEAKSKNDGDCAQDGEES